MAIADNANQTNDNWTWGGLLGDFKKGGQKFLDFLQSPDAITLGMGILRSQSPNLLGALTEGYDSYRGEKQKEAQQKMQQQMLALDAMLKTSQAQKYQQQAEAMRSFGDELRAELDMGGGTPTPGGRMPTFAPLPGTGGGALTQTGGLPPAREQTIPGEDTSGMSLDARIAAGYAPTEEEIQQAITQEGRGSSGQQVAVPGAAQQIAQQAISRPQAARSGGGPYTRAQRLAAKGYFAQGKLGEAAQALAPQDKGYQYRDVNIGGQPAIVRTDKEGNIVPLQGLQPHEKRPEDLYYQEMEKAAGKRSAEEGDLIREIAQSYDTFERISGPIIELLKANPDLKSGPGTELGTRIRSALGMGEGAPIQEVFNKWMGELIPKSIGTVRTEGVRNVTQNEVMNLIPQFTPTLLNSRKGIEMMLTFHGRVNPYVQAAKQAVIRAEKQFFDNRNSPEAKAKLERDYTTISNRLTESIRNTAKAFAQEVSPQKKGAK